MQAFIPAPPTQTNGQLGAKHYSNGAMAAMRSPRSMPIILNGRAVSSCNPW